LLAAWLVAEPAVEGSNAFAAALKGSPRRFGARIDLTLIRELTSLFAVPEPESTTPDFDTLLRRTDFFMRFYQHAVPFSRDILLTDWRRCRYPDDPDACTRGVAMVDAWASSS
jgi:hypothetical protein